MRTLWGEKVIEEISFFVKSEITESVTINGGVLGAFFTEEVVKCWPVSILLRL